MSNIKSCDKCKYGPDIIACQMGKTGKQRSAESSNYEFNPFQESPIRYYLSGSKNMPCFQPRSNKHNGIIPTVVEQSVTEIETCAACKYGPSVWECKLGQEGQEGRFDAFWNDMYHMPCFESDGTSTHEIKDAKGENNALGMILFLIVCAVIIYIIFWLISAH